MTMKMNASLLMLGAALAVAAGCTMIPRYERPASPVPGQWPETGTNGVPAASTNAPTARDLGWREVFPDANLQQVIALAIASNRDLRLAALNVERVRALYGVQRAELVPALNANAGGTRQRIPADLSSTGHRQIASDYGVNLGVASWEPDFFGLIRSQAERARQEFLASEQTRRNASILIVESVAQTYLALATDRARLALAESTLQAQRESARLIQGQHDAQLISALDVQRAQTQVEAARGDVAAFTQRVAQDRNALNLLAGAPVPEAWLPAGLDEVQPPRSVSPGLPSDVLLNRPDVLQAESQLRAADADIGAARAAFFPRISLTAAFGTASSDLSGLFKGGSAAWNFAPQATMPLFDARVWSAYRVSKAQRAIAVATYEKAVQSAFRDVADTLAAHATVDEQLAAQEALVAAVAETHRLARSRYDKGLDGYLGVLDAQRSLYAAQQGLVALKLAKLANNVQFYAVLGGGWQASENGDPAAASPTPKNRE